MAQTVSLSASPRQATGKGAARQARFRGRVPAVIYGHGRDTQPLELEAKALEKALQGVEPASTIIDLAVDGKTVKTLIREIQRHPIRPDIIHVDFYEIHATEKVKLKVPVHLVGNPDGVRNAGGVLDQVTREVEIEVLPENIPDRVELDVNALKIGDSLHVRDLSIPNAKILTEADLTIATVVPPRAEEVAAPSPEAATEVAEPELIRKVREGEEEEGEAGAAGGGGVAAQAQGEGGGGGPPPPRRGTARTEKRTGRTRERSATAPSTRHETSSSWWTTSRSRPAHSGFAARAPRAVTTASRASKPRCSRNCTPVSVSA